MGSLFVFSITSTSKRCEKNSWKHIHYRHLRSHRQHPIRSEPERGGSGRLARVLLCVCVWEQLSGMRRQTSRRGAEGVIKLKRLGEDELLRIHESRHGLYNSNPVQSASAPADCAQSPFIQTKSSSRPLIRRQRAAQTSQGRCSALRVSENESGRVVIGKVLRWGVCLLKCLLKIAHLNSWSDPNTHKAGFILSADSLVLVLCVPCMGGPRDLRAPLSWSQHREESSSQIWREDTEIKWGWIFDQNQPKS